MTPILIILLIIAIIIILFQGRKINRLEKEQDYYLEVDEENERLRKQHSMK